MIYALLTYISAPSPTAIPVALKENLTDLPMWLEVLGIVASIILGGAALFISFNAYAFAKKQQQREEAMRQREAKIATFEKITSIANFFVSEIFDNDFFLEENRLKSFAKINSVRYTSLYLFDEDTFLPIEKELVRLARYMVYMELPDIDELVSEIKQYEMSNDDIEKILVQYQDDKDSVSIYLMRLIAMNKIEPILTKYRLSMQNN